MILANRRIFAIAKRGNLKKILCGNNLPYMAKIVKNIYTGKLTRHP